MPKGSSSTGVFREMNEIGVSSNSEVVAVADPNEVIIDLYAQVNGRVYRFLLYNPNGGHANPEAEFDFYQMIDRFNQTIINR